MPAQTFLCYIYHVTYLIKCPVTPHLSHAVRETEDKVVFDVRDEMQCHLMISLGLTTETSDEITRQRHV